MLTFLAMQVFAAVLGLYAGGFSARWGSRQTFMVGTAGMAIFTGLILIATYDWQVIVLAALAGMLTRSIGPASMPTCWKRLPRSAAARPPAWSRFHWLSDRVSLGHC